MLAPTDGIVTALSEAAVYVIPEHRVGIARMNRTMHEAARAGSRCACGCAGANIAPHRAITGPRGTTNRGAFGGTFCSFTAATIGAGPVCQSHAVFTIFFRATGAHLLIMIVWIQNRALRSACAEQQCCYVENEAAGNSTIEKSHRT